MLRTNMMPQQLIKHNKIFYSITSLVFCKFMCGNYPNGLDRGTQSWGTPSTSKRTTRVSLTAFVGNPDFSILAHRVRHLKNLFVSWPSFSRVSLKSETKDVLAKDMFFLSKTETNNNFVISNWNIKLLPYPFLVRGIIVIYKGSYRRCSIKK